ncbi:hypothetical protein V2J09_012444 [Rumex salicifolius]
MAKMPNFALFWALFFFLILSSLNCWALKEVGIYELKKGDLSLKLTNYGATLISLQIPDKNGKFDDVVLGYNSVKDYYNDSTYFGAVVGRVANRIGGAQFTLNGVRYKLKPNQGKNMLHGGVKGYSRVVWSVEKYSPKGRSPYITFAYHSYDGEEVRDKELLVQMSAKALNKATPVNLAQHTYWNLGGQNSGNILSHKVQIFGSKITPVDKTLIPTGEFMPVKGTPYDFLKPRTVGSRIGKIPGLYDINYVLDVGQGRNASSLKHAAVVEDTKSGRRFELWTNEPGVQFYTGNYLVDVAGKGGSVYGPNAGLCLETQDYPDAVNQPSFPLEIVSRGETYVHYMLFKFSARK